LYKKTSVNKLLNVNTIAVLFVAGFAVFDVALHFLTGIAIREFLPGTITATQTYHGVISRAYGFANEPGTLAFYFNTLGILALWELWKLWNYKFMSEFLKFFLTGLLIVAWICTRSAAGFAFMPFSVIIVLAIRFCYITNTRKIYISQSSSGWNTNSQTRTLTKALRSCQPFAKNHRSARRTLIVLATLSLTIFLVVQHFESVKYSLNPIIDKVTLQESSSSAEIRVAHWEYAIDNLFDNPFFGKGIGYLSSKGEGSSHDWYLFLALEAGLIATGSFVAFLLLSAVRILKSRIAMKYWFLVGFLASVFNFTISSTIFNPFLWILIAVFTVVEQKSKEQQIAI
ncbi:MAG: hypothetical protein KAI59_03925, partial [Planctomycetes bacterium]|nr:hypothetical protein [Planctomycetota bacterium]